MDCSLLGSSVHGDFPSKNTGVGCHALLQGVFPTQGSHPGFSHCRWILYRLSHQGRMNLPLFFSYLSDSDSFNLCPCMSEKPFPDLPKHNCAPQMFEYIPYLSFCLYNPFSSSETEKFQAETNILLTFVSIVPRMGLIKCPV